MGKLGQATTTDMFLAIVLAFDMTQTSGVWLSVVTILLNTSVLLVAKCQGLVRRDESDPSHSQV
jgi:hypothetical protein